ncbi:major capsid protein [Dipodfec virus UA06Rod_16]|uniref:Major capsid protein n=1 Tax=Dipodfec virus UA06Rod_16 TaxID=2929317 RepID=A0A976N1N0_9VIRU|nr:major capsid protein [Dipodfec virus UA06Rod_16]
MGNYKRPSASVDAEAHFSFGVSGDIERSKMTAHPLHLTTFNAGDIIPIYCREVLPNETLSISLDSLIRQTTLLTPSFGTMYADFYAFFVPNRVVNRSWKAVMGENYNGSWTAASVSLATLGGDAPTATPAISVPVGSVLDYYGVPTQAPISMSIFSRMHDLKIRGYIEIYNQFFRDQNYQPPVPYSKLNIYQGFLRHPQLSFASPTGPVASSSSQQISRANPGTGEFGVSAIQASVNDGPITFSNDSFSFPTRIMNSDLPTGPYAVSTFNALGKPFKANKLHDYFTSVLPSPQKAQSVFVPTSLSSVGTYNPAYIRVLAGAVDHLNPATADGTPTHLKFVSSQGAATNFPWSIGGDSNDVAPVGADFVPVTGSYPGLSRSTFTNLYADITQAVGNFDVSDLRMAAAVQQVYEQLARSGSRYREYVKGFFGIEVDDPFDDIPQYLGHMRRQLDIYQTAQTNASESGSTPQGNLAAFGYTSAGGKLFTRTFLEHGYLHILCVVRHRNVYSSYLARDNFRLSLLDFYQPMLATISEQPVYTREVNPFLIQGSAPGIFGYQEAWAEYRYEPDSVSGYMRPGISESLAIWNYADDVSTTLGAADGDWLKSNSEEVLNRTLVTTSDIAPQFKAAFQFIVTKELPMPTYSVPGLDVV